MQTHSTILRRVPEAKLTIKYGDRFGVRAVQDRYRRTFSHWGVLPHRLHFHTKSMTTEDHLRTTKSVDLPLDAFPYQGTMTSLESLAVGTPIISDSGLRSSFVSL